MKVQSLKDLVTEMRAVARGEIPAPPDANQPSIESADALLRILTRENRELLRLIRDNKPNSIAELARMSHRAEPNLLRTLDKLEAAGFVEMQSNGNRRVPTLRIKRLHVEIDPYAMEDKVKFSLA